jgi:hypothetical protein
MYLAICRVFYPSEIAKALHAILHLQRFAEKPLTKHMFQTTSTQTTTCSTFEQLLNHF